MSELGPPTKKAKLSKETLSSMTREQLLQRVEELESLIKPDDGEESVNDSEDKLKQQLLEATRRESLLIMRLTSKEQELQDCMSQLQEIKACQNGSTAQLKNAMLDPAVNLVFQRMKVEMDTGKEKLEQAQNDLSAFRFTPDSQTGKRLMARCRQLLQENAELGKSIASGRTAKLESDIALQKKLIEELRNGQSDIDEFLVELDEDTDGMQGTILFMQKQLKSVKEELDTLRAENKMLQQASGATSTVESCNNLSQTASPTTSNHVAEERTLNIPGSAPSAPDSTVVNSPDRMETDSQLDQNGIESNHLGSFRTLSPPSILESDLKAKKLISPNVQQNGQVHTDV